MRSRLVPVVATLTLGVVSILPIAPSPAHALPTATPERIIEPVPVGDPTPALPIRAVAPLTDTFELASRPGADLTIYLDVDGQEVAGTAWNIGPTLSTPDAIHPAWDPAHNGASFKDDERLKVQEVWARVAEDFAPFDVNVTTKDPGDAALVRTDGADQEYGVRVLITPSTTAQADVCGGLCGGIAYMDWFSDDPARYADYPAGLFQPAWVFPQSLGPDVPKWIADAASHEVGHTLGLSHDGKGLSTYYDGTATWGPLMGAPYESAVSQWSKGDYTGANQTEDDLAIIGSHLPLRADEAGAATAGAPGLSGTAAGFITASDDTDLWALGSCTGPLTVDAQPAPEGPNLDIELQLVDASGTSVATANPPLTISGGRPTGGLGATVSQSVEAGDWFVRVDGVGNGSHYPGYGSLGAYTLAVTGSCSGSPVTPPPPPPPAPIDPTAPGAVRALAARWLPAGRQVELTWQVPSDTGGADPGYTVTVDGVPLGEVDSTTTTINHLLPGRHTFTVRAVNGAGESTATTTSLVVPRIVTTTTLTAPRRAKQGTRPKVTVAVQAAGSTPATGTVQITVGRTTKVRTLRNGVASWKLPRKLSRKRRATVVVTYAGAVLYAGSADRGRIRFR